MCFTSGQAIQIDPIGIAIDSNNDKRLAIVLNDNNNAAVILNNEGQLHIDANAEITLDIWDGSDEETSESVTVRVYAEDMARLWQIAGIAINDEDVCTVIGTVRFSEVSNLEFETSNTYEWTT